jgi:hypothetical protein
LRGDMRGCAGITVAAKFDWTSAPHGAIEDDVDSVAHRFTRARWAPRSLRFSPVRLEPHGVALASRGYSTGTSTGCSTGSSQSNPTLCPQSQTQRRLRASCFADISWRRRGGYVKCDLLIPTPMAVSLALAPLTLDAFAIASPLAMQRLLTAPTRSCRSVAPRAVA